MINANFNFNSLKSVLAPSVVAIVSTDENRRSRVEDYMPYVPLALVIASWFMDDAPSSSTTNLPEKDFFVVLAHALTIYLVFTSENEHLRKWKWPITVWCAILIFNYARTGQQNETSLIFT
jgi:hypothetical protein